MPLQLDRVHVYARHEDPTTGEVAQRLVEYNPFLRLSNGVETAPIYIQNGVAYGEGGDEIHDLPDWFYTQLSHCTDEALIACGWKARPEPTVWQPEPNRPAVYSRKKSEILAKLASLSESELETLLGLPDQPAPVPLPSEAPMGTPATPINMIDADDFPPDDEDELLLPSIPPPMPVQEIPEEPTRQPRAPKTTWTCPQCEETMPKQNKGGHMTKHIWERKRAQAAAAAEA